MKYNYFKTVLSILCLILCIGHAYGQCDSLKPVYLGVSSGISVFKAYEYNSLEVSASVIWDYTTDGLLNLSSSSQEISFTDLDDNPINSVAINPPAPGTQRSVVHFKITTSNDLPPNNYIAELTVNEIPDECYRLTSNTKTIKIDNRGPSDLTISSFSIPDEVKAMVPQSFTTTITNLNPDWKTVQTTMVLLIGEDTISKFNIPEINAGGHINWIKTITIPVSYKGQHNLVAKILTYPKENNVENNDYTTSINIEGADPDLKLKSLNSIYVKPNVPISTTDLELQLINTGGDINEGIINNFYSYKIGSGITEYASEDLTGFVQSKEVSFSINIQNENGNSEILMINCDQANNVTEIKEGEDNVTNIELKYTDKANLILHNKISCDQILTPGKTFTINNITIDNEGVENTIEHNGIINVKAYMPIIVNETFVGYESTPKFDNDYTFTVDQINLRSYGHNQKISFLVNSMEGGADSMLAVINIQLNPNNEFDEITNSDNSKSVKVKVGYSQELKPKNINYKSQTPLKSTFTKINGGDILSVDFDVENIGYLPIESPIVVGTSNTFGGDFSDKDIGTFKAHEKKSVSYQIQLPENISAEAHSITFNVDKDNIVDEDIEDNNSVTIEFEVEETISEEFSYYPFEDNANDIGHWGYNGIMYGNVSYDQGMVGRATVINGNGGYIKINDYSAYNQLSNGFTLAAWVNPLSVSYRDNTIMSKVSPYRDFVFKLRYDIFHFHWHTNQGYKFVSVPAEYAFSVGEWNHVVTVWDDPYIKMYINGQLVKQVESPANKPLWTSQNVAIGAMAGSELFKGLIDEMRVYDEALTDNQVLKLYNETYTPLKSGSIDYTKLLSENYEIAQNTPEVLISSSDSLMAIDGINKAEFNDHISLFPTPAKDEIHVQCDIEDIDNISYRISDVNGRVLSSDIGSFNNSVLTVNTSMLNNGIYVLELKINDTSIRKRFVIKQ